MKDCINSIKVFSGLSETAFLKHIFSKFIFNNCNLVPIGSRG